MSKNPKFENKIISNKVLRRDYSKVENTFEAPNLLDLQRKSFKRFIEIELEQTIKSIFPIKSINGKYILEYGGMKLEEPRKTEAEARNEGKTYDRPLKKVQRQNKRVWTMMEYSLLIFLSWQIKELSLLMVLKSLLSHK